MFIEALFTIAKICKQPKCPSVNEWRKQLWYIKQWNTTHPLKRKEKKKILLFATAGPRENYAK